MLVALLALMTISRADETWSLDNLKSIAGHEVSVVGHPTLIDTDAGKALRLDGAHDGIFLPAIPTAGSVSFTIEVLFRPMEGGETEQRFFHLQDTADKRSLLEIRVDHKGGWWLDAFLKTKPDPDKGLPLIDPTKVHPTNRWYWVAMRYDEKRFACFVNGVKQVEADGDFTAIGEGKVSIGVRQNLLYWFKGDIREIRWHREAIADSALQRR
jgi:hypothetical protein